MKTIKLIGVIFSIIGIGFLIGSIWSAYDAYNFLNNSELVKGEIINIVVRSSRDSDGNIVKRRYPVIQFTDKEGSSVVFESSSSIGEGRKIGEIVQVRYLKSNPQKAKVANSFTDTWGPTLLLVFLGLGFTIIGGVTFWFGIRDSINEKRALSYTKEVKAKINGVFLNELISVNGRHPFVIEAQWLNPDTNKIYIFKSKNFWYDPSDYLEGKEEITVKMDPMNPKKYWVDVSFLPKEA